MGKKTDLVKICDELEECKTNRSCYCNEIVCARKKVKHYIGNDYNKLLMLKAQIKLNGNSNGKILNSLAILISGMAFETTAVYNCVVHEDGFGIYVMYAMFCLLILSFVSLSIAHSGKKNGTREKWEAYIEVVLDEIYKDIKDGALESNLK